MLPQPRDALVDGDKKRYSPIATDSVESQSSLRCICQFAVALCGIFCVYSLFVLPGKVSAPVTATIAFAPLILAGLMLVGIQCCLGRRKGQEVEPTDSEAGFPQAEEFMRIAAGKPWGGQAANHLLSMGRHFSRAHSTDAVTTERIFSPSEHEYLKQCGYSDNLLKEVAATPIVNYMVWRRSQLGVLVLLSFVVLLLACRDAMPAWRDLNVEAKPFVVNYGNWSACERERRGSDLVEGVDLSFSEFTKAYMDGLVSQWAREMVKFRFLRAGVEAAAKAAVCLCIVATSMTWQSWKQSSTWIMWGWAILFATPFLLSLIPLRAVTRMETITGTVPEFLNETMLFYHLEDTGADLQKQLVETCRRLPEAKEETLELIQMQKDLCMVVDALPKIDVNLLVKHIYANPDPAKNLCAKANKYTTKCDSEQLYDSMSQACDTTKKTLGSALENQNNLFTLLKQSMTYLGNSLDAVLGLMNAIMSSKTIWPAAMSLGPGLLQGALRAKAIVPQASVSGIFIVLLPILYVPFTWVLANLLVQFSGSLLVLGALATFAFSPLGSSMLSSHFGANMPLSREEYDIMEKQLGIWSKAALLVSLLFVVAATSLAFSRIEGHLGDLYTVARSKMIGYTFEVDVEYHSILLTALTAGANFLLKLEMTTVATTDLMLRECALQRQLESLVAQADTLPPSVRAHATELEKERKTCLNALVIAFGGNDEGARRIFGKTRERFWKKRGHRSQRSEGLPLTGGW